MHVSWISSAANILYFQLPVARSTPAISPSLFFIFKYPDFLENLLVIFTFIHPPYLFKYLMVSPLFGCLSGSQSTLTVFFIILCTSVISVSFLLSSTSRSSWSLWLRLILTCTGVYFIDWGLSIYVSTSLIFKHLRCFLITAPVNNPGGSIYQYKVIFMTWIRWFQV